MGIWSAYFLAKLLLYGLGYLDFSPWLNLGLAIFTALPPQNARQRFAKNLIAVPLGVMLLYYDSWLPPIAQAVTQAQNLSAFSESYLLELAARLVSWKLLLGVAVLFAVYSLARRKLRLSTVVFIGILAVLLTPEARLLSVSAARTPTVTTAGSSTAEVDLGPAALDARLARFYAQQKQIQVQFPKVAGGDPAFDILILHVCSLSWDDLKTLQTDTDGLFAHFDIVLANFNSAASYSGPAAIRLLRGTCGQTPEARLYDPAAGGCLVMDGLQNAGFEPHWVMNHDGHFGNFFGDVQGRGGLTVSLENDAAATPAQQAFDGTPVYSDYSVLSRWWEKRLQNHAPRVVLYYNTISLHDGNRVIGPEHADSSYGARFANFSSDITRFLELLRSSGRHVVVVLVAEHGAALRGDRRQIQGLREIPTSAIAHVPVAIALINAAGSTAKQSRVEAPVSYPALNELLSQLISNNPFVSPPPSFEAYTGSLPHNEFVAENDGTVVLQVGTHYMMRSPDGAWSSLDGIDVARR